MLTLDSLWFVRECYNGEGFRKEEPDSYESRRKSTPHVAVHNDGA
jgi:hypothetical protein